MKKSIIIVFAILFVLINQAYAANCQYSAVEYYNEIIPQYYSSDTGKLVGPDLIIGDFGKTEIGKDYFKLYNTLPEDIVVVVKFSQIVSSDENVYDTYGTTLTVNISKGSFAQLETMNAFKSDFYNYQTKIDNKSIEYKIIKPAFLQLRNDTVIKNRTVCKMCAGNICLDDGVSCNPFSDDTKCGSGICNIAGMCGTSKIVDCPIGLKNCNDLVCVSPYAKAVGEKSLCDWECKSSTEKNSQCVEQTITITKTAIYSIISAAIILIIIIGALILKILLKKEQKKQDKKKE